MLLPCLWRIKYLYIKNVNILCTHIHAKSAVYIALILHVIAACFAKNVWLRTTEYSDSRRTQKFIMKFKNGYRVFS